jgi:aspartyl-tRNA(Asn)/glutamyl-tRNA(Gln) amidotransferase subunit C
MTKVTREELLKIAKISNINIHDDEIDGIIAQLESVLSYAERVKEVAADVHIEPTAAVNVFRKDQAEPFDAQAVLAQAPEQEEDFFVVPKILDSNA